MNEKGKATVRQRAEVERLAEQGLSIRRIAVEVFGDTRYRGRVERILKARNGDGPAAFDPEFPPFEIEGLSDLEVMREFFRRRLRLWAASGKAPSPSEQRGLLDVKRRLDSLETLERLRPTARG
jgi:hypothetical protein